MSATIRSMVLPIYVPMLVLRFCRGMLVPVLPIYAASFGVSASLVGLAVGMLGIGTIAGDLPAGILVARYGVKRTMLLGVLFVALSMLLLAFTQSYLLFLLFYFLTGIGFALWNISLHGYMAHGIATEQRGKSIALLGGLGRMGTFLGPVVGGTIATLYSENVLFGAFALLAALALCFPFLFLQVDGQSRSQTDESKPQAERKNQTDHHNIREQIRYLGALLRGDAKVLSAAGIGQLFAQTIRSGRSIIIPLYGDAIGLDLQSIGLIVSIAAAVDMSLFPVAGLVMDRLGRKFSIVPSFLIQGIGMALIPFMSGFSGLLLASCIIGFGNGLSSGTMMTLGADLAPQESLGQFLGLWRFIGDMGQAGGPLLVGGITDLFALAPATLVVAGIGIAASSIFALFVPETLHRKSTA